MFIQDRLNKSRVIKPLVLDTQRRCKRLGLTGQSNTCWSPSFASTFMTSDTGKCFTRHALLALPLSPENEEPPVSREQPPRSTERSRQESLPAKTHPSQVKPAGRREVPPGAPFFYLTRAGGMAAEYGNRAENPDTPSEFPLLPCSCQVNQQLGSGTIEHDVRSFRPHILGLVPEDLSCRCKVIPRLA